MLLSELHSFTANSKWATLYQSSKNKHLSELHSVTANLKWTNLCAFITYFDLKRFPQMSQLKGFSPVCILSCRWSKDRAMNILEQNRHWCPLNVAPKPWTVTTSAMKPDLNSSHTEWIKMPCLLPIFSQSDYLIQIFYINSHTEWQTVQCLLKRNLVQREFALSGSKVFPF